MLVFLAGLPRVSAPHADLPRQPVVCGHWWGHVAGGLANKPIEIRRILDGQCRRLAAGWRVPGAAAGACDAPTQCTGSQAAGVD